MSSELDQFRVVDPGVEGIDELEQFRVEKPLTGKERFLKESEEMHERFKGHPGKKAFGFLQGLGDIAQTVSGGLQTPEQFLGDIEQREKETPEETTRRELGKGIGQFAGALAVPLPGALPPEAQKPLITLMKKHGFSENQIVPFLQTSRGWDFLGKFAKKNRKTEALMESIYQESGNVFKSLKAEGKKMPSIRPEAMDKFENEVGRLLKEDIALTYHPIIRPALNELLASEMRPSDFMRFNMNINAGAKGVKGGKAAIGLLKDPSVEAIASVSKPFAEDFKLANELYTKQYEIAKRLSPTMIDQGLDVAEVYGLGKGMFTGNVELMAATVGTEVARIIAREMLINPKLHRMSQKIGKALEKGNFKQVTKTMDAMYNELERTHPEEAKKIREGAESLIPPPLRG